MKKILTFLITALFFQFQPFLSAMKVEKISCKQILENSRKSKELIDNYISYLVKTNDQEEINKILNILFLREQMFEGFVAELLAAKKGFDNNSWDSAFENNYNTEIFLVNSTKKETLQFLKKLDSLLQAKDRILNFEQFQLFVRIRRKLLQVELKCNYSIKNLNPMLEKIKKELTAKRSFYVIEHSRQLTPRIKAMKEKNYAAISNFLEKLNKVVNEQNATVYLMTEKLEGAFFGVIITEDLLKNLTTLINKKVVSLKTIIEENKTNIRILIDASEQIKNQLTKIEFCFEELKEVLDLTRKSLDAPLPQLCANAFHFKNIYTYLYKKLYLICGKKIILSKRYSSQTLPEEIFLINKIINETSRNKIGFLLKTLTQAIDFSETLEEKIEMGTDNPVYKYSIEKPKAKKVIIESIKLKNKLQTLGNTQIHDLIYNLTLWKNLNDGDKKGFLPIVATFPELSIKFPTIGLLPLLEYYKKIVYNAISKIPSNEYPIKRTGSLGKRRKRRKVKKQPVHLELYKFFNYDRIVRETVEHIIIELTLDPYEQALNRHNTDDHMTVIIHKRNRRITLPPNIIFTTNYGRVDKFHKISAHVKKYLTFGYRLNSSEVRKRRGVHKNFSTPLHLANNQFAVVLEATIIIGNKYAGSYYSNNSHLLNNLKSTFTPGQHHGAYVFILDKLTNEYFHAFFHETEKSRGFSASWKQKHYY